MAEAMTYASLLSDVQAYAERNDTAFVDQIPRFVMLAENKIAADPELHGLGFTRAANSTFTVGDGVIEKPARWRETSAFSYLDSNGNRVFLRSRGYTFCREYWPDSAVNGAPKYYCDYDYDHFLVVGIPDAAYSFELMYRERPLPLDTTNQTNWTTKNAPQLLLYGTLLEAQAWLKNNSTIQVWQERYAEARAAINNESERRVNGDESLRRNKG